MSVAESTVILAPSPGRVGEGVLDGDRVEGIEGAVSERPSRRGQDEPRNLRGAPAAERLVERAVLGVDGEDRRAGRRGGRHHRFPCDDEDLLVRERERLAELHRLVRRRQARGADDGAEDDVGFRKGRDVDDSLLAPAHVDAGELATDPVRAGALLHRHDRGAEACDGGEERFEVRAGRHRDDAESVGEGLEDRERRLADGSRGAEKSHVARRGHRGRSSGRRVRIP
jgi:hypothetical protein